MAYELIKLEKSEVELPGGQKVVLAQACLNSPPVNALSPKLLQELSELIQQLEKEECRVLIITGEGKAFIAGADISVMKDFSKEEAGEFAQRGQKIFSQFEQSPVVTIAAVNGFALGGGLEFALACDIRVLSEKAVVGLPEVGLGVIPAFGGTQRLARMIGEGNAKYLTLTGGHISAEEAFRLNLAQKIASPESLMTESEKIAREILSKGPKAVVWAKSLVHASLEHELEKGFQEEKKAFVELFSIQEANEGMNAFIEKRPANFS